LLKGGSAYIFFKHHPKSRLRLPKGHLWSAGGCATTVGYNDFDTVKNLYYEPSGTSRTSLASQHGYPIVYGGEEVIY
ncbi:MAG: hypothetical protein ABH824_00930, partial [Nanoarchaeota archaeon]|nr:hypothetical protein [Nanoarchaeota archaeon]